MRILIMTEAGAGIGMGHLCRMRALAAALRARGARVGWRVHPGSPADPSLRGIPWSDWWAGGPVPADLVVVDSYRAPLARYAELHRQARLVVVDDFARLLFPADLVVNPGLAGPEMYPAGLRDRVLAGPSYVLIRPEFLAPRADRQRNAAPGIMITAGGGDQTELLAAMAEAALRVSPRIEVVCGGEAAADRVKKLLPRHVRVRGKLGALAMRRAMDRADLAVTGAGQTLHELNARRVAMVAVLLGEDQKYNMDGYVAAGALRRPLRLATKNLSEKLVEDLSALCDSRERARLTRAAARLVDGGGAGRVARAILGAR